MNIHIIGSGGEKKSSLIGCMQMSSYWGSGTAVGKIISHPVQVNVNLIDSKNTNISDFFFSFFFHRMDNIDNMKYCVKSHNIFTEYFCTVGLDMHMSIKVDGIRFSFLIILHITF